jgi:glycerol-3-phosphate acyltransferase PlsY
MALLSAIIVPFIVPIMANGTIIVPIIRYYCSLFFLLFSIIVGYRHQENGNVQTARLDPIMEE